MAPLVLSDVEVAEALTKGSSDLRFLFEKNDVDNELQALFFHSKITNMAQFAALVPKGDDLRELIKVEFGIDANAGLQHRVRVTNVLISFNTATTRMTKQAEMEGELESKHLVKPMAMTEFTAMRVAWQQRYWELDEDLIPARCYLEKRAEELEQGEYRAEPLTAVLTKEQDDPDIIVPVWSSTGTLQMRKGNQQVEEPRNPEQLRKRLKILGLGLMFLSLKHSNRAFLTAINPQLFEDYACYLLSEHCFYLQGKSAEGFAISGPSWNQLLIYEFQVRRKTWTLVQNQGMDFATALRVSWRDPCVKERFLTTPIALSAAGSGKRYMEPSDPFAAGKKARSAGHGRNKTGNKAKGSGKGKGKGKGKQSAGDKLGCASRTPDGQPICYGYNDTSVRCKNRDCRFMHRCGGCFGQHPLYACKPGNRAETQGSGNATD